MPVLAMIHVILKTEMASSKVNNLFRRRLHNVSIFTNMVWAIQLHKGSSVLWNSSRSSICNTVDLFRAANIFKEELG